MLVILILGMLVDGLFSSSPAACGGGVASRSTLTVRTRRRRESGGSAGRAPPRPRQWRNARLRQGRLRHARPAGAHRRRAEDPERLVKGETIARRRTSRSSSSRDPAPAAARRASWSSQRGAEGGYRLARDPGRDHRRRRGARARRAAGRRPRRAAGGRRVHRRLPSTCTTSGSPPGPRCGRPRARDAGRHRPGHAAAERPRRLLDEPGAWERR